MPDTPDPRAPHETILAFDFGLRRIGVAVGQTVTGSASPVGVVRNGDDGPDWARIAQLVSEWRPRRMIVGLPLNLDGTRSAVCDAVEAFAADLARFGAPVETVDERHSSSEAAQLLTEARQRGTRGRIAKENIDAAAATLIAERWLRHEGSE